MASNSERIQEHTSRIEDVVNQIITAGGFVFVDTEQNIKGIKTFSEMVGISNVNGTTDYLKHINNNFLISTSTGTNLLNIDEGLNKIYAFNKELAFKEDIVPGGGSSYGNVIVNVTYNDDDGIFTFTREDGSSFDIDTLLEKVVTNFTYNENTQNLELTLEDGSVKTIPMSAFIDDYSGSDGDIIAISVSNDNKISATIKDKTISKTKLTEDVQNTLDEVGANSGKIDSILNTWDSKADVSADNLSDDDVAQWKRKLNIGGFIDDVASDINEINSVLNKTERVEIIYDMNDSTKDFSQSGGLYNQVEINVDLTKYKRLIIYGLGEFYCGIDEVNLNDLVVAENLYITRKIIGYSAANNAEIIGCNVDATKTKLTSRCYKYETTTGTQTTSAGFKITKIEGVY